MTDMTQTVSVSTDVHARCSECITFLDHDQISEKINHYLGHGYRLLHVGQQTTYDQNEIPWQTTVAVLGRP